VCCLAQNVEPLFPRLHFRCVVLHEMSVDVQAQVIAETTITQFTCGPSAVSDAAMDSYPPLLPALQLMREHPDFISIGRLSGCVGRAAVVALGLERHMVAGSFNFSSLLLVGLSNESNEHDPPCSFTQCKPTRNATLTGCQDSRICNHLN